MKMFEIWKVSIESRFSIETAYTVIFTGILSSLIIELFSLRDFHPTPEMNVLN